jgi:hypothetical protein
MAVGGLTKGKSHAEGGIPMVVKSTGQKIEVEGGEGILNKYAMSNKKKFEFEGEMLTTCQIASRLNQKKGDGVRFECDDVEGKKYLFNDGGLISKTPNNLNVDEVGKIEVHPDFYSQALRFVEDKGARVIYIDKSTKTKWKVFYTKNEDFKRGMRAGRYSVQFNSKFNPSEARIFMGTKMIGVVNFKTMSESRYFPSYLVVESFDITDRDYKDKHAVNYIVETILESDDYHKGIVIPCDIQQDEVAMCMKMNNYNRTDNFYIINKDYGI